MKQKITNFLLALTLLFFLNSCATTGTKYTKIEFPETKFLIEGVSILSPRGESWYFFNKSSDSIAFGKVVGNNKYQSLIGTVDTVILPSSIESKEDILSITSKIIKQKLEELDPCRFDLISNDPVINYEKDGLCVRYRLVARDYLNIRPKSSTSPSLILEIIGVVCKHPYSDNAYVTIGFSQRTKEYEKIGTFEPHANKFIENVIFIPFESNNSNLHKQRIKIYSREIEINRKDSNAYFNRGNAYRELKKFEKSIIDYNKAIKLDSKNINAYFNRGSSYSQLEKYEAAIKDYSKVIELNPKDAEAYSTRGVVYCKFEQYKEAIKDFRKSIEIDSENGNYFNNMAWFLATCPNEKYRNGAKAVTLAKKAVAFTKSFYNLDTLAAAYAENRDFEMAVKTAKQAYDLAPNKKEYKKEIENYQNKKTYAEYIKENE